MDEEKRLRIAREDLEPHREKMIRLWGTAYTAHPEYLKVVREVAAGRYPHYALYDRLGQ